MKKKLVIIGHYHGYELLIDVTHPLKDSGYPTTTITQMAESFISHAHKTNEVLADLKDVMEIR